MATNSDNFDLSNWKLSLPVNKYGSSKGKSLEIKDLEGYEHPKYFYDTSDDAMVFRAHAKGATTKNSKYARSELREMDGDKPAAWTLKDGGTMSATLAINETPTKDNGEAGRFMIGQIHGEDDELVRLYSEGNQLYFANEHAGSDGKEHIFHFTNAKGEQPDISLNETFSYVIDARGKTLNVTIHADDDVYESTSSIHSFWKKDTFYFKAGVYMGINDDNGYGAAKASFYGLDVSHEKGKGLDGLIVEAEEEAPVAKAASYAETPQALESSVHHTRNAESSRFLGDDSNNHIFGGNNNNILKGYSGNDRLDGGAGRDILWGNDGDDVLIGGLGVDIIKGGNGVDRYVYRDISEAGDYILDFRAGETLDIAGLEDNFIGAANLDADQLLDAGYLSFTSKDDHTVSVYVDVDGNAGEHSDILLAELSVTDGLTTYDGSLFLL